jgi:TfoX/Sxy family transcriptional regulator of competence genes
MIKDLDKYKSMIGEYIVYHKGEIVGEIYDDRLLIKSVKEVVYYM